MISYSEGTTPAHGACFIVGTSYSMFIPNDLMSPIMRHLKESFRYFVNVCHLREECDTSSDFFPESRIRIQISSKEFNRDETFHSFTPSQSPLVLNYLLFS